ncbi:plant cysteine oxidase 2-like isoform X2 [Andrographis paniculata]|uniref:plant cysteine oxidase 2-like isoform X2 n=1 Tax=Andrographis paniculata TaxID=175694 RepID=UPI0021E831A8|nr:plant cysteine oxidase 2-like isoform X2 [Andrographis paniculata]
MQMGFQQNGSGGKGNSDSKRNKRKQKRLSPIQKLYETCKEVFADCGPYIVPTPDKVEKLAVVLDGMTHGDVGLRPNMPIFSSERAPIITYLHIYECDKFSIGIFCLPPTSVIPLHNHPGMTVFGKLLFGTMHIKAYDWSNEVPRNKDLVPAYPVDAKIRPDGMQLAKLKVNSEFTAPCRTSILYPADGGNMHCFTAKTACAVLDVLGPPYCDPDGRHCQYYYEYPFSEFPADIVGATEEEKESYAWLMERDKPEELSVVGLSYDGPKIAKK